LREKKRGGCEDENCDFQVKSCVSSSKYSNQPIFILIGKGRKIINVNKLGLSESEERKNRYKVWVVENEWIMRSCFYLILLLFYFKY